VRNREHAGSNFGKADIFGIHGEVSEPANQTRKVLNTARNIQSHQKRSNFITGPDPAFINDIKMAVKIILAAGNRLRN